MKVTPTHSFEFMYAFKGNTINLVKVIKTTPLNLVCGFSHNTINSVTVIRTNFFDFYVCIYL
jgi:hypothetical protein